MLFRPNFCANCGEKIERSDWGFFTSRRFCQVCESVYKGHDLLPRVVVGLGIVIGLFGIGAYLNSGEVIENHLTRQPRRFAEQAIPAAQAAAKDVVATQPANRTASPVAELPPITQKAELSAKQPIAPRPEPAAEVYICGAQTVKGPPCKRRVKGNARCFQHTGMPALLSPDKLRVN